jgi:hypothetical protein
MLPFAMMTPSTKKLGALRIFFRESTHSAIGGMC